MKKSEIKKRMQDGFSELSPDMFETIWEAAEEQRCFTSERACQKSEESFLQTVFIGKISKYAASACAVLYCCAFAYLAFPGMIRRIFLCWWTSIPVCGL